VVLNACENRGHRPETAKKHLAAGAVDFVCLLSPDDDEFPDTGYIRMVHNTSLA